MKHAGAVSLALFLGSMTLLAQSSGHDSTQPAVAHVEVIGADCPIDMRAQRQTGQGTLTSTGQQPQKPAQKLRLTLTNPKLVEIVGVRITVYGSNAKSRMSPAQTAESNTSEIKKIIDLKIKISGNANASTDVMLPAFTSVRLINLDAICYGDGSNWRSSALHTCQVVPDGAMLISSL